MPKLRYVGASPNTDLSVVSRGGVDKYIQDNSPVITSPAQQARDRGAVYPAQSEVSSSLGQYATKLQVSEEANKYFGSGDVGVNIVSLENGMIPADQRPPKYVEYLEPTGAVAATTPGVQAFNRIVDSTISTFTVGDPGFSWSPFVSGYAETRVDTASTSQLYVKDQAGRIVGRGVSNYGGYLGVTIANSGGYSYSGSHTFTLTGRITGNNGSAGTTGWSGGLMVIPVPA